MKEQILLIFGILMVIIIAWAFPYFGSTDGPLVPTITTYTAIFAIFFINGFCLETEKFTTAFLNYKAIFLTQFCAFAITPIVMYAYSMITYQLFKELSITNGFLVVGCLPPPVSLGVILTSYLGGNEAMAIINSAIGSISGILLSPILISIFLGIGVNSFSPFLIFKMLIIIILPCTIGQTLRYLYRRKLFNHLSNLNIEKMKSTLSIVNSFFLLFIIYVSFCDLFYLQNIIMLSTVFKTIMMSCVAQVLLLTVVVLTVLSFKNLFDKSNNYLLYNADLISIITCSSMKSLTIGILIIKSFENSFVLCEESILPVLLFEPIQLIFGLILSNFVKKKFDNPIKLNGSSVLYGLNV